MRELVIVALVAVGMAAAGIGVAHAAPNGGERFALVIGIDQFQGSTRWNTGAVGDAEDVKAVLTKAKVPAGNIKMLTDSAATASAIRDGLRWIAARSTDSSLSIVAYSGHVKQVGSTEYWWPHDNQHIADTELAASLKQVKGHLWVHISGCEAAGFDERLSGPTRLVTAASQADEKGYELSPELRNSVFTSLLVDKGMLRKQGDANKDKKVSIQEAFRFAERRAPQITANEAFGPQHPYMAGAGNGDWFLER
ncbi:MAG: caspase family protein [Acidimicrobiales bacterium]